MKALRSASSALLLPVLFTGLLGGCNPGPHTSAPAPAASSAAKSMPAPAASGYRFEGGFPTEETRLRFEDDSFVAHAIELYGHYLPTLTMHALRLECERVGALANRAGVLLTGAAKQRLFAPSLDVPTGLLAIDLEAGPVALEIPAGALTAVVNDQHQRWVLDHAATPASGTSTKYVFFREGAAPAVPAGHLAVAVRSRRAVVQLRALPVDGSIAGAEALLRTVRVHAVDAEPNADRERWIELGRQPSDFTPVRWEKSLDYWRQLHEVLTTEFAFARPTAEQADAKNALARIGVRPGEPFAPSEREKKLLSRAAVTAQGRLHTQAFSDRSSAGLVWTDRQWEWLTPNAVEGAPGDALVLDRTAQEKWAFQAAFLSPASIRRTIGTNSYDWFTTTDRNGTFLDGSSTYRLLVPLPVPAKLFWSITLHDPNTRAELSPKHKRATLRSFVELIDLGDGESTEIYIGPSAPPGQERRWVQTVPEQGFVVHFRLHQPASDTLERTWQLGDLEAI